MKSILIIGEDALCCQLAQRLVTCYLPDWSLAGPPIDKRGITKLLPHLNRFAEQARYVQPVFCLSDTDGRCALEMLHNHMPAQAPQEFLWRLAVVEAESWVLADRNAFAEFFRVPMNRIPQQSDAISDPKRLILDLMRQSKERRYREEMVSQHDPTKTGTGYNQHLCSFIRDNWRPEAAKEGSGSLRRAIAALLRLSANCTLPSS